MFLGVCALFVLCTGAVAAPVPDQLRSLPAAEETISPPTAIPGLDVRPSVPLEFSRAWLGKMARVRQRRAELKAAGRLDGMSPEELAREGAALSGTLRVPVIPVVYDDVDVPFHPTLLERRLFGPTRRDTVSYRDYWDEVSGGLLEVEGTVTQWIRLPDDAEDYLSAEEYGWARFGRVGRFREQAIEGADRLIDFGQFDNDGPDGVPNSGDDDGYVDFVAFLYAVPCPGDARAGSIWPHRGAMEPYVTKDEAAGGGRIKVADYVILPAVDRLTCEPLQIGVLAHETAHSFGLPDLYDYDGSSKGIGEWGLMGTGTHSAPHSPAHLSAWAKEQLGWVEVRWLRRTTAGLEIPAVERTQRVYRYDLPDRPGHYLLLENRQRVGSDAHLPGTGLLVWRVDPDRAEIGAWNADEARPAVGLVEADGRGDLAQGLSADEGDPFPGAHGRSTFTLGMSSPFRLDDIRDEHGVVTTDVVMDYTEPALVATPAAVELATVPDGGPVSTTVRVRPVAGAKGTWNARSRASWLRVRPAGDSLVVEADPAGLEPGTYTDTVDLALDDSTGTGGAVAVRLTVPAPGTPYVVARRLPWGWGLAAQRDRLVQASYGWDPIALRLRPQLFRMETARAYPHTLARLPADALYAPAASDDGNVFVLARAQGRNYVFRVDEGGRAAVVAAPVGTTRAYGLAALPGGELVVAHWNGELRRITPDGRVLPWAKLGTNLYQIASDRNGTLFAASYDGDVIRVDRSGAVRRLETGFGRGRLVTVATDETGAVYAAERGGAGRILRIAPDGTRTIIAQVAGAEFYGLTVDDHFLYALDLGKQRLLRIAPPSRR